MVPHNLRWGNGTGIRPPNILRSTVFGCEAKYELTKKGVKDQYFLKEVFGQEKGIKYVIYQISDCGDRKKTAKDRQNRVDD